MKGGRGSMLPFLIRASRGRRCSINSRARQFRVTPMPACFDLKQAGKPRGRQLGRPRRDGSVLRFLRKTVDVVDLVVEGAGPVQGAAVVGSKRGRKRPMKSRVLRLVAHSAADGLEVAEAQFVGEIVHVALCL